MFVVILSRHLELVLERQDDSFHPQGDSLKSGFGSSLGEFIPRSEEKLMSLSHGLSLLVLSAL